MQKYGTNIIRLSLSCILIIVTSIMKKIIFPIFLAAAISSCGSIYSPTLNLPHEPLAKNQGLLTGTLSVLPQQGSLGTLGLAGCGEGQIAYGFSDRFSIVGKAWSQASELYNMSYNGGTTLSGVYRISSDEASIPLAVIASTTMLIEGREIKANGGSAYLSAWLPEFGIFRPYLATGAGIMAVNFKSNDWGYGGLLNAGISTKLSKHLFANFEVFGGVERYIYYHQIQSFLAPSLSISWKFENN